MSTDLREVKEQILTMRQAQRLTGKLSALAEEMAALSPAGVIVMAAAEIEAFDPKKWMNEEVPARIAELEREIRSEGHDGQR